MKKARFLVSVLSLVTLTSCSFRFSTGDDENESITLPELVGGDGYYVDDSSIDDVFNYQTIQNVNGADAVPSKSDSQINLLCLPIEVSDYPFSGSSNSPYSSDEELYDDLDRALNGSGKSETGYWESLSSFYYESSFGQLNLNFTIADIYETGKTARQIANTSVNNTTVIEASDQYIYDALEYYEEQNPDVDIKDYDNDSNGYIDGIIAIYSAPNYSNSPAIASIQNASTTFWAYTYWVNQGITSTASNPIPSSYIWASYDFLYEADGCSTGGNVDPHTLIHEFGHMLGLDDYYDYEGKKCPAGACVMMDQNIYDHDAFSKLALGWLTPYVVTDSCTITIKPITESGECIILPVPDSYNGTAFDEYILMELFTPTGLNELDATTAYKNRTTGYTKAGIRLWHIDARIGQFVYTYNFRTGWVTSDKYYADQEDIQSGSQNYTSYQYKVAASNSKAYCTELVYDESTRTDTGYELIHLIQASKKTTLSSTVTTATNSDLFNSGDTFSLEDYSAQFPNGTTMNSGDELPYTVSFSDVSSSSATITITSTN